MTRFPLVLLLLAACATAPPEPAAAPEPTPAAAPAAEPAAMPSSGIMGEYTTTLAPADVPTTMPDSIRNGMIGTWNIGLHDGGHVAVAFNGRPVVEGAYRVEGDRIMFSAEETGVYACRIPATYTWQMTGNQLSFTRVEDTCEGRVVVLTTRPLTRGG